ncbi:hypothetical protein ACW73L_02190 [Methylolobus aquaticus]
MRGINRLTPAGDVRPEHAQWQPKQVVAASEPPDDPPTARLEAFIKAMRSAPVTLDPSPILAAIAGIRMSEANASPVPSSNLPWARDRVVLAREMTVVVMDRSCQ